MALGAVRIVPVTILAQAVVTIGVLAFAAPSGLEAVALSAFAIVPFCGLLSLAVIRHFLKFDWLELASAVARSAAVTLSCAAGPLAVIAAVGWRQTLSVPLAIAAGVLAGVGWIVGLWMTRHPLLQEMMWLGGKVRSQIALKYANSGTGS